MRSTIMQALKSKHNSTHCKTRTLIQLRYKRLVFPMTLSSVTDISKLPVDNQQCCSQALCMHMNLSQAHLNTMAGYWHLQIQLALSTHLRMQKSARAHINKVISGASIKKQSHQSLKQRAEQKMLYPRKLVIHTSASGYQFLKTVG